MVSMATRKHITEDRSLRELRGSEWKHKRKRGKNEERRRMFRVQSGKEKKRGSDK